MFRDVPLCFHKELAIQICIEKPIHVFVNGFVDLDEYKYDGYGQDGACQESYSNLVYIFPRKLSITLW
jgi:hypothetical protein